MKEKMNRLINVDYLIAQLKEIQQSGKYNTLVMAILDEFIDILNDQPITYDVEKEYKDKDCSKCSRRSWYQKGYADAEKKFADDENDDFCEWFKTDKFYPYETSCGNTDLYDDGYKYCAYCGKKIKVVDK